MVETTDSLIMLMINYISSIFLKINFKVDNKNVLQQIF